ncbi:hypothetical protein TI04_04750 [Achromatium sp. WMS2]|nr:hypothetical protein TI04_04750 [Achromatium sp. WMS2]
MHTQYADGTDFITKDGSLIRELMHPNWHGVLKQSLALARVPVNTSTLLHSHKHTEELYHITQGCGAMQLDTEILIVNPGDTVCINSGVAHCIRNIGTIELVFLCCCSPAYSHQDTEILSSINA